MNQIFGSKAGIADGRVLIPLECSGCSAATAAYLVPCHNDVDVVPERLGEGRFLGAVSLSTLT